ncbi:DUF3617 domain-containing protein [Altererythrobacter sp. CAU 1778]
MRLISAIVLTGAFALAACGSNEEADAPTEDEVAAAMEGAVKPLPGQYDARVELLEFEVPGVPDSMVGQMKDAASGELSQGHSFCLTQADVEDGWRGYSEKMADGDCTFNRFDVDGTRLDAEMACKIGTQGQMTEGVVQLQGETGEESQSMVMTMNQNLPMGSVRMKMKMDTQRTGDCTTG